MNIRNDELEKNMKKPNEAYFEALYQHLPDVLRKSTNYLSKYIQSSGSDFNLEPPEYESGDIHTEQRYSVLGGSEVH
jgi:hypothetical protein